jgi:hypothetical protein
MIFFRRILELKKEHANGGKMANIYINGTVAATTLVFLLQYVQTIVCGGRIIMC